VEEPKRIWFKKLTKKEVSQLNKNIVVFAFFLLLAFIFWYLNSLGKEFEVDVRYSVRFINQPKGKEISVDQPAKLMLEVKGQGYSLLKHKLGVDRSSLVIDLSKTPYRRFPDSGPTTYYILTSSLVSNFKKQIGNGFQLLSVKPDSLFLTLNPVESSPGKR
jgi:hypothetical protein